MLSFRRARNDLRVLLAASLAAGAFAQGTPQALIGGATAAGGTALARQIWCQPSAALCNLPMLPPPAAPFAGGTAYNSFNQVAWTSNGPLLLGVSATSVPPCAVVCGPVPVPGLPAGSLVAGLAFDELGQTLIAIDSTPSIRTFATPPVGCPVPGFVCNLAGVFPPNLTPGGLAYSEKNNLLYFSVSNFAGGAPMSLIFATRAPQNPCVPLCAIPVPLACPAGPQLGPITGLAFDDATDDLYLTDGVVLMRLTMNIAISPCAVAATACCVRPLVGPYHGLELEPSHPLTVGAACTAAPCPVCPAMALGTSADPTVGTPFNLSVNNAPSPGNVVLFMGFPGCTAGVPIFCGLFHPSLAVLVGLPAVPLVGPAPCGGAGGLGFPIPLNYALPGLSFCVQGVVVCAGAGLGLTNALNATITDN